MNLNIYMLKNKEISLGAQKWIMDYAIYLISGLLHKLRLNIFQSLKSISMISGMRRYNQRVKIFTRGFKQLGSSRESLN